MTLPNRTVEMTALEKTESYSQFWRNILNLRSAIFLSFLAFVCWWFRNYLSAEIVAAVDLPGHINIIEKLSGHWWKGRIFFYDPLWFTGWPAYLFYGFFSHYIAAVFVTLLSPFTTDPGRLVSQSMLVIGSGILPMAMYYAVLPMASYRKRLRSIPRFVKRWTTAKPSTPPEPGREPRQTPSLGSR